MPALLRPELARRIVWEAAAVRAKFPGASGSCSIPGGGPPGTAVSRSRAPTSPSSSATRLPTRRCRRGWRRRPNCRSAARTCWSAGPARAVLCWIGPASHRARRRWDPQRHTAATVLRAAQRRRWRCWSGGPSTNGPWPTPGRPNHESPHPKRKSFGPEAKNALSHEEEGESRGGVRLRAGCGTGRCAGRDHRRRQCRRPGGVVLRVRGRRRPRPGGPRPTQP